MCSSEENSNSCTAALAVYLLLFNASYYPHSPNTASGAHYRRSACIDMDMLRLAAEFQHSEVYYVTIGVEKNWKLVLMQKVVTLNICFDRRQPTTGSLQSFQRLKERNKPSVRRKTFFDSEVSEVTFSGGVGKWITVCFLLR